MGRDGGEGPWRGRWAQATVEGSEVSTVMYWHGPGRASMAIMPAVWIVPIGLIVWAAIGLTQRPASHDHDPEAPEEILDRRYASGEIDADTYTARKSLAEHRPG